MENPNPTPQGGQAPEEQQPSVFEELKTKKGFKDPDSLAKSYTEIEQSYGRTQNAYNKAKQSLETQSQGAYTLDEKGEMILTDTGKQMQQQQQYGNQQQEPVYDPYTGQAVTDPIALQLARMPLGQREAFLFNAMAEQRERQQMSAFQHETEILSKEEAKGFEQDVKKVMMSMPIAQRSNKQAWENALLQVKGARYDNDKQNWGQQANEGLLNKMGNQGLPSAGQGGGSGTQLPANLAQQYQWYEKNRPGFFKNKEDFMKYTTPSGGK